MKPVHFRGQNYDPVMLSRLQGQGHTVTVPTKDIITLVSAATVEARIAFQVEDKYHLLTGSIDARQSQQQIHVVSRIVLKKALVAPTNFEDRQADARDARVHRQEHGHNSFGGWRR